MRMIKKVKQDNYFHKLNLSNDILLDSLTKVISRRYIVGYLSYLISKNIHFSMAIIDIDNFKSINDTYGHMIGDKILSNVADIICENSTDDCYVGRYGGDEFIVVLEGEDSYDATWQNLKTIFTAIRRPMTVDILTLNVTCTAGAASYPKDCSNFEDIFNKSDRLLYRGKQKGRNCFIIYVKEKHQELGKISDSNLPDRMNIIDDYFKGDQDLYYEIYESFIYLVNYFKSDAAGLFELDKSPLLFKTDVDHTLARISEEALENHYVNNVIMVNSRSNLDKHSRLRGYMEDYNIRSLLLCKVTAKSKYFGYLMICQEHYRIWQEDDIALLKYLASIIGLSLYYNEEN